MTIDFSCAIAWQGNKAAMPNNAMKARMLFRVESIWPPNSRYKGIAACGHFKAAE